MRYIIYGAGAVGGTIGARLAIAGKDVLLICRGAHYDAVKANGLLFQAHEGETRLQIPAASHPREIVFRPDDVVVLTTKTHQTEQALADLEAAAGDGARVICAQNGVENERMAARRFREVYGMLVYLPARHLVPGEVMSSGYPKSGVLHAGRFPGGIDPAIEQVCADLTAATFTADADPAIMRLKYVKLVHNLSNANDVIIGRTASESPEGRQVARLAREEAEMVLAAANIEIAPPAEVAERMLRDYTTTPVRGQPHDASSTLQSVMRGQTTTEVDYLNGEIVLLGKIHGVPTPVNAVIRRMAAEFARTGHPPVPIVDLLAAIEAERGT